jgi:hypothetical protein
MPVEATTVILALAIIVMLYCLWLVLTLKSKVPGGVVGTSWRTLTMLVVLFAFGYAALPFFGDLPESTMRMVVALIFLFGAFYVAITIRLIYKIIEELSA